MTKKLFNFKNIFKHKHSKIKFKSLAASLVTTLVLLAIFLKLTTPIAQAAWYDDSYAYREKISFTHNAAITGDRSVTYTLDTAEIIAASEMQTDCDDIRFTDANGKSLLYDLTGTCNDAATTFEIIFPSITNGTNIAYVYYGNPSAVNAEINSAPYTALTPNGGDPSDSAPTATQEQAPSPVSYWNFDQGSGTTANDSSKSSSNDLTITNALWKSSEYCVTNNCLYFDGNADRASKSYSSDTELLPGTGSFSVSVWLKHSSTAPSGNTDTAVSRVDGVNGVGWKIYENSSGNTCFGIDAVAGSFPNNSACTTTSQADSTWHHILAVKSGTTSITIFLDGKQITQTAGITASSISGTNAPLIVGNDFDNSTNGWDGFIDELKYYNFAKSSSQILAEFNSRTTAKQTSAQFGDPQALTLNSGLVGYWNLDDNTGSTTVDSSGNNRTGTLTNSPTWSKGKFDHSILFDGVDDMIAISGATLDGPTPSGTISMWIYTNSSGVGQEALYSEDAVAGTEFQLSKVNNIIQMAVGQSDGNFVTVYDSSAISTGIWYHIVTTFDSPSHTIKMYRNGILTGSDSTWDGTGPSNITTTNLGNFTNSSLYSWAWNGYMDNVRAYNRALSDREVKQLYEWAPPPAAYWKFDDSTGQTVTDSSGNGNNGTLGSSTAVETIDPLWTPGKYGSSLQFNGSTSNRYVGIPDSNSLDMDANASFTITAWVRRTGNAQFNNLQGIFTNQNTGTDPGYNFFTEAVNTGCDDAQSDGEGICFRLEDSGANRYTVTTTSTMTADSVWHHIAMTVDRSSETNSKIYLDGVPQPVNRFGTFSGIGDMTNAIPKCIGVDATAFNCNTSNQVNGNIDELKIYRYVRTPKQIIQDMNGDHPAVGTPVGSYAGYWNFDESKSTTANDKSPNLNSLTLSSSSWTTSGKYNSAWIGTGSVWASRADDDDFDFDSTEDFSVSFWAKDTAGLSSNIYVVDKSLSGGTQSAGYAVYVNTSGAYCLGIDDDTTWGPDDQVCTTKTGLNDSAWHHIVATKTGTSQLNIYLDGKLSNTLTSITATATLANARILYVGDRDGVDNGDEFIGTIDELKIYRSALSLSDVQTEYNRSSTTSLGAFGTTSGNVPDNSLDRSFCPPGDTTSSCGPVAWWKFDENTGTTTTDSTSNANVATFNNSPNWTSGIHGGGVYFNSASTSYLRLGTNDAYDTLTVGTVSAWVKLSPNAPTAYNDIFSADSGTCTKPFKWAIRKTGSAAADFAVWAASSACDSSTGIEIHASITNPYAWHQVVYTTDTGTNSIYIDGVKQTPTYTQGSNLTQLFFSDLSTGTTQYVIGGVSTAGTSENFEGTIDDIKIFNYSLSPAQVAWDYNRGKPVGWWKFDDCQGSVLHDSSGNGYDGTINIGGSGTATLGDCTTSSTAWGNGATGKYSSSLTFDGTDDYVDLPSTAIVGVAQTGGYTVSAWIKPTGDYTDYRAIYYVNSGGNEFYLQQLITTGRVRCGQLGGTVDTTVTPTANQWTFVTCTWDGSTTRVYLNGNLRASGAIGSSLSDNVVKSIGREPQGNSQFYSGQIDDLKIFAYTLNQTQIKTLYNEGSTVRFGPLVGSP